MGMISGGPGAFIGPAHRIAAELGGESELVAGVVVSDPDPSRAGAIDYHIDPARGYPELVAKLQAEAERDDGVDFVAIVTPNYNHLASARSALEAGLPVISNKPMTATLAEARELDAIVARSGLPYALTYTYSGYRLVREARARIAAKALGRIRKVVVEYAQGWLADRVTGKQAEWRADPERAGVGGCIGDIGVHAFHLAEFVTGLRVTQSLADLAAIVPVRQPDDDCSVLLRFENGARGLLLASQIEVRELKGLRIRVYGDSGRLSWRQEELNSLTLRGLDGRTEIARGGEPSLGLEARARTRTPGGHPEGYYEAFANLYRDFAARLRADTAPLLPTADDGDNGMTFIDTAVRASAPEAGWVSFEGGQVQ